MERTIYECDSCGERFGAKNEVVPVEARLKKGEWGKSRDVRLHFCVDCHGPAASDLNNSPFVRFLVDEDREIAGVQDGPRSFDSLAGFDRGALDDRESLQEVARAVKKALN